MKNSKTQKQQNSSARVAQLGPPLLYHQRHSRRRASNLEGSGWITRNYVAKLDIRHAMTSSDSFKHVKIWLSATGPHSRIRNRTVHPEKLKWQFQVFRCTSLKTSEKKWWNMIKIKNTCIFSFSEALGCVAAARQPRRCRRCRGWWRGRVWRGRCGRHKAILANRATRATHASPRPPRRILNAVSHFWSKLL